MARLERRTRGRGVRGERIRLGAACRSSVHVRARRPGAPAGPRTLQLAAARRALRARRAWIARLEAHRFSSLIAALRLMIRGSEYHDARNHARQASRRSSTARRTSRPRTPASCSSKHCGLSWPSRPRTVGAESSRSRSSRSCSTSIPSRSIRRPQSRQPRRGRLAGAGPRSGGLHALGAPADSPMITFGESDGPYGPIRDARWHRGASMRADTRATRSIRERETGSATSCPIPSSDWLARRAGFEPATLRSEERWSPLAAPLRVAGKWQ